MTAAASNRSPEAVVERPYGAWQSSLDAQAVVAAALGLSDPSVEAGVLRWQEARPAEKGRVTLMERRPDGTLRERTPAPWNVRTRVHEYGGRSYAARGEALFFSHFADQRVYRIDGDGAPRALTPEVADAALRYADFELDPRRDRLYAVREDHRGGGEAVNTVVLLGAGVGVGAGEGGGEGDAGRIVAEGCDFYAAPRLSPCGTRLAWLQWRHPDMPWDGTELMVAELDAEGLPLRSVRVAGSRDESIVQPLWAADGSLVFVSDASGWWNLQRWRPDREGVEPLLPMAAEFASGHWQFGLRAMAWLGATELVCSIHDGGRMRLGRVDLTRAPAERWREVDGPLTSYGGICADGETVFAVAASPRHAADLVRIDLRTRAIDTLRRGSAIDADPRITSEPQALAYPSAGGRTAHALYYPPKNGGFVAPAGERPPLLVFIHGGPTSATAWSFKPALQYWTSRGFAVLDVNYGGSTGYGRAYRQLLKGRWGEVDVEDCAHGARFLAERGLADAKRLLIRGGSAGGYTTLAALAFHDVFAAGASLYGVADLETLAQDTHKFESRYLDGLIGPYPAAQAVYVARSPIHHIDRIDAPVILFQGSDDLMVPPSQSRRMREALAARGVPVAYIEYEGEGHGFRQAANIVRTLEAELSFYAQLFGFAPADAIEPVAIENAPARRAAPGQRST